MHNVLPPPGMMGRLVLAVAVCVVGARGALAQQPQILKIEQIEKSEERVEMLVGMAQVLELEKKIQTAQVTDENLLDIVALQPNQVQLIAKKAGITYLNFWDEEEHLYTVGVIIDADARQLNRMLQRLSPDASVRVTAIEGGVFLEGFVGSAEEADKIQQITEIMYPNGKVINSIGVGGVRQVMLRVKIMEVERTKLRQLGFNFRYFNNDGQVVGDFASSIGELITETATATQFIPGSSQFTFALSGQNNDFLGFLEALRRENLLKILAEPNLVAASGRPASFLLGGEFPFQVASGFGQPPTIQFKPFGTRLDFVPTVLGDGHIRLEVRPEVSEIKVSQESGTNLPTIITRRVDTAVTLRPGETLAIAGLISTRQTATAQKFPVLGEIPSILGTPFRRISHQDEEVELVVLVTPELVSGMAPEEVPPGGPGDESATPDDREFFLDGKFEVPTERWHVGRPQASAHGTGDAHGHGTAARATTGRKTVAAAPAKHRSGKAVQNTSGAEAGRTAVRPGRRQAATPASGLRLIGPHGYSEVPTAQK